MRSHDETSTSQHFIINIKHIQNPEQKQMRMSAIDFVAHLIFFFHFYPFFFNPLIHSFISLV